MSTFFTSDTHFNHANIINLSKRPFKDVNHMNEVMVNNWNEVVKPEDTIIHLGDFAMGPKVQHASFLERLNGYLILVRGNHDQSHEKMMEMGWDEVMITHTTVIDGLKVYMAHVPVGNDPYSQRFYKTEFTPAPPEYDIWLCGHVHNAFKRKDNVINVGVDVWDFRPVDFKTLLTA